MVPLVDNPQASSMLIPDSFLSLSLSLSFERLNSGVD
jgi:hypothetical protein